MRFLYNLLFFVIFLIMLPASIYSIDNYKVHNIKGEEAPFDALINCFYKDKEGYIWIGASGNLFRYDGDKYRNYTFDKVVDQPYSQIIYSIIEDASGEILVGNMQGLWRLNRTTSLLEPFHKDKINNLVIAMESLNDKTLIASHNSIFELDLSNNINRHIIKKNEIDTDIQILDLLINKDDKVWVLSNEGIFDYDLKSRRSVYYGVRSKFYDYDNLKCFVQLGDHLIIGTESGDIIYFDTTKNRFTAKKNIIHTPLVKIDVLNNSHLIMGTANEGVILYSLDSEDKQIINIQKSEKGNLLSDQVSDIFISENKIFIGYKFYVGFDIVNFDNNEVFVYETKDFSTSGYSIRSLLIDNDNKLIGTRKGFYFCDNDNVYYFNTKLNNDNNALTSDIIFSFKEYNGKYLVGTCRGGITLFDPNLKKVYRESYFDDLNNTDIFKIENDYYNNLWIATLDGLFYFDSDLKKLRKYDIHNSSLPNNIVWSVTLDDNGKLWVCTESGIRWFDYEKQDFVHTDFEEPENDVIRHVYKLNNKKLCFISHRYCKAFIREDDSDNQVLENVGCYFYNVVEDKNDNMWFGTNIGVIKIDKEKNTRLYSTNDGMPDPIINVSSQSYIDQDDKIWFCNISGLIYIIPNNDRLISPIKITDIYFNNNKASENIDKVYSFKSAENNNLIKVDFASLSYGRCLSEQYEYILEPIDTSWTNLGCKKELVFYNLNDGQYNLKIRRILDKQSTDSLKLIIKRSYNMVLYKIMVWILALLVITLLYLHFFRKNKNKTRLDNLDLISDDEINYSNKDIDEKYKFSKINEDQAKDIIVKLNEYIVLNKAYLKNDLKQSDLADAIGYSSQILSQVFTGYLNCKYYDYINTYRVEEFKKIVTTEDIDKYTLNSLAERCGFSSQSSFFRSFKKITGCTPNEFINNQEVKN